MSYVDALVVSPSFLSLTRFFLVPERNLLCLTLYVFLIV